jgi:predicted DNA-binding protein
MRLKSYTLRLPADQAAALEVVARADEKSVNAEVREAIDRHIEERRQDPAFQARVREFMETQSEVLKRLA